MTLPSSLHAERTWLRRYPTWLFFVCFIIAYWLNRQDSSLSFPVLLAGVGVAVGQAVLELRYDRHVRDAAPQLIAHVLAAPITTPLRVRRSAPSVIANLFQISLAGWIGLGIPEVVAELRTHRSAGAAGILMTATMVIVLVAMTLIVLGLAWSALRRIVRTVTGRALLEIDEAGIRIDDLDLTVAWTEIDGIYCFRLDRLNPGLALRLIDPVTTLARSTRWPLPRRTRPRLRTDSNGWLLIPDNELREPLADVLGAAITQHRAATS
ncbi:hypothetical protein F4553_003279 [Allocatelliglobosispora scoriae]|uniref:PH domain-containing protein n=1 Tax=Allocatelliglobosispora scoriae TaxID=643052 RepID=A0A841BSY8_9ACTN|nr:hypothetical protein [Allocatelliglobosispora scoriae]MBB5869900.1 hypothetical protein [Allocatelliglobosispora scoriae]